MSQSLFNEYIFFNDLKGTSWELNINSVIGFSMFYPKRVSNNEIQHEGYNEFYYSATGMPVYEIHTPELVIYVDKITNDRIATMYDNHKKLYA